jgi:AcrR family transcriptional regulator
MKSSSNRTKLVNAARELFTLHGYNGVSIDDIAAQANLTKGAVYYQFADKTALFVAACELVMYEIIDIVTHTTMDHATHSMDEIVTGSEFLFEAFKHDDARRLLVLEGPTVLGAEKWSNLMAPMRRELAQHALQHIADDGQLDQSLVMPLADIVTGAFNQAVLLGSGPDATPVSAKMARDAYRHLVSGLLRRG